MFSPLKTALDYSYQTLQQKPAFNTDNSEQKTTAVYKSKIHAQEPNSIPYKKQTFINSTDPKKFAGETAHQSSSKSRKLRGKYAKYPPKVKEAALAEVHLGTSINQTSKIYGIKYSTLRNWTKLTLPTAAIPLYHEYFAVQDALI